MTCDQTSWTFHEGEFACADVRALLRLHFSEMRGSSPPEACHVLSADALAVPEIRLFSLRDGDGCLLGVGALKSLAGGEGEIKSMRTAPAALGRCVGRVLLDHLMVTARAAGMARISLETGNSASFDAANRLYTAAGFERGGAFGDYAETPFTRFYTRLV